MSKTSEELFEEGLQYFNEQKFKKSIKLFSNASKKDPNNPKIYQKLGLSLLKSGFVIDARSSFDKAILLNTNNPEFYLNRIEANKMLNNYSFIIKDYKKLLEIEPGNSNYQNEINKVMEKNSNIKNHIQIQSIPEKTTETKIENTKSDTSNIRKSPKLNFIEWGFHNSILSGILPGNFFRRIGWALLILGIFRPLFNKGQSDPKIIIGSFVISITCFILGYSIYLLSYNK